MEKMGTISDKGLLYIPKPMRDDLGEKVTLVDAPRSILVFPQNEELKHVLKSLEILKENLRLRQKCRTNRLKNGPRKDEG